MHKQHSDATDRIIEPQHLPWQPARSVVADPQRPASFNSLPLLYLEPTLETSRPTGLNQRPRSGKALSLFLQKMNRGHYDEVLTLFLRRLKQYRQPVLLTLAPRFDDPSQPWGTADDASLKLYREAWQHVVRLGEQEQAANVVWVWCPAKPTTIASFYPDADSIDWLGIDVVNRPDATTDSAGHSFATLYQSLHNAIRLHTVYDIRQKPVLITNFGTTVATVTPENQWISNAMTDIRDRYPEIKGAVFASWQATSGDSTR